LGQAGLICAFLWIASLPLHSQEVSPQGPRIKVYILYQEKISAQAPAFWEIMGRSLKWVLFPSAFAGEGSLWEGGGKLFQEGAPSDKGDPPLGETLGGSGEDLERFGGCSGKWFDIRCQHQPESQASTEDLPVIALDTSQSMRVSDPSFSGGCSRSRSLVALKNRHQNAQLFTHHVSPHYEGELSEFSEESLEKVFCESRVSDNALISVLSELRQRFMTSKKPIYVITDSAEARKELTDWLGQHNGIDDSIETQELSDRLISEFQ